MTIVHEKDLDANDFDELGENVTECIRIDHDAAMNRSLDRHDEAPPDKPRVQAARRWMRRTR